MLPPLYERLGREAASFTPRGKGQATSSGHSSNVIGRRRKGRTREREFLKGTKGFELSTTRVTPQDKRQLSIEQRIRMYVKLNV